MGEAAQHLHDLLQDGQPAFLAALDVVTDPECLKTLARRWYPPARPAARALLLDYLAQPLNAFHEPLVVRLLRRAERAGDDEVMGCFLLSLDRSLRRKWRREKVCDPHTGEVVGYADSLTPVLRPSHTERGQLIGDAYIIRTARGERVLTLSAQERRAYEAYRLFAVPTRLALRRRVWRYFRRLGQEQPKRYVPALAPVLKWYTDEDTRGEALLDNWGLLHVLSQQSGILRAARSGWVLLPLWQKAELPPADPPYEALWRAQPEVLLDLLRTAQARVVREWVGRVLAQQGKEALAALPVGRLIALLWDGKEDVVNAAADLLRTRGGLEALGVRSWAALLRSPSREKVETLVRLMERYLAPETVTLEQAVDLACSPVPEVAFSAWNRLVRHHLKQGNLKPETDGPVLLRLLKMPAEWINSKEAVLAELRAVLQGWPTFEADWARTYLHSESAPARAEGWKWFQSDPRLGEDVRVWQWALRSPHEDVRQQMLRHLQALQHGRPRTLRDYLVLDAEAERVLWARVLLTLRGPWKTRLLLVRQLVDRLLWRPEDADVIMPMLALVVRSSRGPAFRAALAGVVQLCERHPEWEAPLAADVPELSFEDAAGQQAHSLR
jgi:hypothetical protein